MKFALTLVFAVSVGMVFADGNCGSCCGKSVYNAKAFDKKDAQFLAMANEMAMGNESKKMACCSSAKTKVAKKASKACAACAKGAKAAKRAHAH
jgi:hypothetical protein